MFSEKLTVLLSYVCVHMYCNMYAHVCFHPPRSTALLFCFVTALLTSSSSLPGQWAPVSFCLRLPHAGIRVTHYHAQLLQAEPSITTPGKIIQYWEPTSFLLQNEIQTGFFYLETRTLFLMNQVVFPLSAMIS